MLCHFRFLFKFCTFSAGCTFSVALAPLPPPTMIELNSAELDTLYKWRSWQRRCKIPMQEYLRQHRQVPTITTATNLPTAVNTNNIQQQERQWPDASAVVRDYNWTQQSNGRGFNAIMSTNTHALAWTSMCMYVHVCKFDSALVLGTVRSALRQVLGCSKTPGALALHSYKMRTLSSHILQRRETRYRRDILQIQLNTSQLH